MTCYTYISAYRSCYKSIIKYKATTNILSNIIYKQQWLN